MMRRHWCKFIILVLLFTSLPNFVTASYAKPIKHSKSKKQISRNYKKQKPSQPLNIFRSRQYAAIVLNADNGQVLYQVNAHSHRHPASLAKMMTLYLLFEALKNQEIILATKLKVSPKAAQQLPSKLGLKAGEFITARQAINALIVKSANDAAVAAAENLSGSEWQFIQRMNATARRLKMHNTIFKNATGWHNPRQVSTAYDLALLSMALRRDFPQYYHLFSQTEFTFNGKVVKGHNRVLERYAHADGLKTGFINASGFNLATSAINQRGRLVAVVMGGQTPKIRDDHMINLLERSYLRIKANTHLVKNTGNETSIANSSVSTPFHVLESHDSGATAGQRRSVW